MDISRWQGVPEYHSGRWRISDPTPSVEQESVGRNRDSYNHARHFDEVEAANNPSNGSITPVQCINYESVEFNEMR